MLAQFAIHACGRQAVSNSLANERAELREEQLAGDARKRARTKRLHANGAEASFPCGVEHEARFAFRSPCTAWQAAPRFRDSRKG